MDKECIVGCINVINGEIHRKTDRWVDRKEGSYIIDR